LRIGAVNPYPHCWHFVVFAVVVFAALLALGLVACKGRLGGLKETRGGRCAASIAFIHSYLRNRIFILAVSFGSVLFALLTINSQKRKTKFSPAPENFA
jgi:hypothetical protein